MKKLLTAVVGISFMLISFLAPREASAVPAFARQTGMACNSCHFQHFPILNAFGRAFKAGGFTMVGGQSLVEGDFLSLPSILNASLITKVRYQKTNGQNDDAGTNRGQIDFPDEAALLLGGRVGEHIGFILEAQLKNAGSSNFASFKVPIKYDVAGMTLSAIPFTTDAFGPQFSFEVLSTGAVRNSRVLEHRTEISAIQYVGLQNAAQGIGLVGYHNTGYINYTAWQPENGTSDAAPFLHYVRVAATPTIAGWDLAAGGQWWGGTYKSGGTRQKAEGWALDAQAQGLIPRVNFPIGVYLSYANAIGTGSNKTNLFNSKLNNKTAWSILAEVGVLPNRATFAVGYRDGDNGAAGASAQDAITFGATFLLTQNFQLQVNHSSFLGAWYDVPANNEQSNGDQLTTLMIFAAF